MTMMRQYWGSDRVYHHTAPITMIYAIREGLRLVHEEGLEARWARHVRNHRALKAGLTGARPRVLGRGRTSIAAAQRRPHSRRRR